MKNRKQEEQQKEKKAHKKSAFHSRHYFGWGTGWFSFTQLIVCTLPSFARKCCLKPMHPCLEAVSSITCHYFLWLLQIAGDVELNLIRLFGWRQRWRAIVWLNTQGGGRCQEEVLSHGKWALWETVRRTESRGRTSRRTEEKQARDWQRLATGISFSSPLPLCLPFLPWRLHVPPPYHQPTYLHLLSPPSPSLVSSPSLSLAIFTSENRKRIQ